MSVLRWILLPVVCVAAWCAAIYVAGTAFSIAESLFCPADQIVSGACIAPWYDTLVTWLFRFFCAFSAALIISCAYFVAPAARPVVVWIVYAAGAAFAFWIAGASQWDWFVSAGLGGLAAVLLLTRGQAVVKWRPVAAENA